MIDQSIERPEVALATRSATGSVGVVIPAYNASRFLTSALASVFRQSLPADDIVVVDDCSSDDTVAIATQAGARVVKLERNGGPASARNVGVAAMPAVEFVAFLDADDLWTVNHLEALRRGFTSEDIGLVHSRTGPLDNASAEPPTLGPVAPGEDALTAMLEENLVSQSAVMVRTSCFREVGGYGEGLRFAEDYDLWIRLAAITRFVHIPAITSLRRLHEGQASNNAARLFRGAHDARQRGIAFAELKGRILDPGTLARTEEAMLRQAMGWSVYHGDRSLATELLSLYPPTRPLGNLVAAWWRTRRWLWPVFEARAALRRRLRA